MVIKRGSEVKIIKKESYWDGEYGKVTSIDETAMYSLLIRFEKVNYSGLNTANFSLKEVIEKE